MHRFVQGQDRAQTSLLPASLEDYVDAVNPARIVRHSSKRWILARSALRS